MRRKREDKGVIIEERYKELQELYAGKDCSFLWDGGAVYSGLLLPTVNPPEDMDDKYNYIGRAGAEHRSRLPPRQRQNISASRCISDPATVLVEALLLAFGQCKTVWKELQYLSSVEALVVWCQGTTGLLFIIDAWEQLDPRENDKVEPRLLHRLKADLVRASGVSVCITVLSINSPEPYESAKSDKDYMFTEEFDGPYTEEELNVQANLPASALLDLDNLTGGIQLLRRMWWQQWLKRIGAKYEDKLWTEFVGKLDSKEDLVAAINMVMGDGKLAPRLVPKIKLTCFFLQRP